VSVTGGYSVVHADTSLKSSYGMKVHPNRRELYVCVGDANYSKFTAADTRYKMARLLVIDLASGKKLRDVNLAGLLPGKHFANDLTFDDAGNCYITDSYAHAIYKVDANGKASVFARSLLFVTEGIGINGIAYHPDGYLLVDNSNTGSLYKVMISDPAKASKVRINQFFLGADGLLLKDTATLVMVVNGNNDKIYQLTSGDGWATAELKATTLIADRFTYPSTATFAGDDTWVMNAKFAELVDSNSVPSKAFAIQKAVFKPIPKKLRK
jgi:sugar lactone lactonase YvrE